MGIILKQCQAAKKIYALQDGFKEICKHSNIGISLSKSDSKVDYIGTSGFCLIKRAPEENIKPIVSSVAEILLKDLDVVDFERSPKQSLKLYMLVKRIQELSNLKCNVQIKLESEFRRFQLEEFITNHLLLDETFH